MANEKIEPIAYSKTNSAIDGVMGLLDLNDLMLKFEIPADAWRGKSFREKIQFIKSYMTKQERGKLIDTGAKLLASFMGVLRDQISNPIAREYVQLANTAINLGKVSLVLQNMFRAVEYVEHNENDELAKFMGYSSGGDLFCISKDSTPAICETFINMPRAKQKEYGILFESMVNAYDTGDAGGDGKDTPSFVVKHLKVKVNGILYGMEIQYSKPKRGAGEQIAGITGAYILVARGYNDHDAEDDVVDVSDAIENIWKLIYGYYVSTIDITKNIIKIDAGVLKSVPRVSIDFEPRNFDVDGVIRTMRTVLTSKKRRGYILQGDPGTGKTVSIHKILMSFCDIPVFWVTSDSMGDVKSMRDVFKILNMFPGSIFVFDDFDGNDFSQKSPMTTTFITCIDETNSPDFSGITILTINEPQRVHTTIKDRRGRIDEIIHVKNPSTVEEVTEVITQRYIHMKSENSDLAMPEWISCDNDRYVSAVNIIITQKFTHAHIAGLIADLVELNPDGYTIDTFEDLIQRRIATIGNARMVAYDDGHISERTMQPQPAIVGAQKYFAIGNM